MVRVQPPHHFFRLYMPKFHSKAIRYLICGCIAIAVWQVLSPTQDEIRNATSFGSGDTSQPPASGRQRIHSTDQSAQFHPNRQDQAHGMGNASREERLASLRAARVNHVLSAQSETTSPSPTPFSAQTKTIPPARVAVAAALLQYLEPEELTALGAHEVAAVTELGEFALKAAAGQSSRGDTITGALSDSPIEEGATDAPIPADLASPGDAAALADSYLRSSIGFYRYNQLSILAAVRAYEAKRAAVGTENRSF